MINYTSTLIKSQALFGAVGETRTRKTRILSPIRIPIPSQPLYTLIIPHPWIKVKDYFVESGVRFELTALLVCNQFPWTTRAPRHRIWCGWWDSNPQNLDFESSTYTNSITSAWLRLTGCFLVRGVYIPVILTREHGSTEISLQAKFGGLRENWTLTQPIMSRLLYH
jgi:hypothetical protein